MTPPAATVGMDYSRWNDVALSLKGKYGTRTSSDPELERTLSIMYVAAPVRLGQKILGVVSVGKPTRNVNAFVLQAKNTIILSSALICIAVVVVTLLLSAMIIGPIERLIDYTRAISRGERVPMPELSGEMGQLARAFEEMRLALEGRQYIENYVQTLTHEMKSPIAAIQGAVELLDEAMPDERRERFHANIANETGRMQRLIDRLLLLSAIENRPTLEKGSRIDLFALTHQLAASFDTLCLARQVEIVISGTEAMVQGETILVEQAISNLLHNALEFSPPGARIHVTIDNSGEGISLRVDDQGPGIPEFALSRIFERFYSLKRPDTNKKSSGLGLSLVREIMLLHSGSVTLGNRPEGGACARLFFPH